MSNMQVYQWTGMNRQGKRVRGVLESLDIKSAELELKATGVEVITISQKAKSSLTFSRRKKIKPKEMILFTRYLHTMLNAGLPILKALEIIGKDQDNEAMKSMVVTLKNSISAGMTLAESMSQFPEYFSELYVNLVKAGEKSATLDKVLLRLVKYLDKSARLKSKVKSALIYPIAIVLVAVVVSLVLLIFVVPQFQVMFQNAGVKLPLFTRIVISFSHGLREYWWMFAGSIFLLVWGIRTMRRKNEAFSDRMDRIILRIPIIGSVIQKSVIARFTRTLAITLDAGLPIVDSIKSMVNIMGNKIYSKAVTHVSEDLTNGNQLASSLESTKLFPNMVVQMIAVGEASGALGEMLNNIANYYEEEVDYIADNLSTILEPMIMIILGVIMGCFIVAMYLPIFKLGSTI